MKIGMIGAESKHVEFFGIPVNKEKAFGKARIESIWGGDTSRQRLACCCEEAAIDRIADTPGEVIDCSDAVIITLRNGALHTGYAIECIKKRKPVFIDKPFTANAKDALSILKASEDYGTPFTGGSTLCFLPEIVKLSALDKQSACTELSYRADPDSPFGGWYFYGSHLTDLCSAICGTDALYTRASVAEKELVADVYYPYQSGKSGTSAAETGSPRADTHSAKHFDHMEDVPSCPIKKVRINSAPSLPYPTVKIKDTCILDDKICYYYGLKEFFKVISTGRSPARERLLFSVTLMNAIMESAAIGKAVPLGNQKL